MSLASTSSLSFNLCLTFRLHLTCYTFISPVTLTSYVTSVSPAAFISPGVFISADISILFTSGSRLLIHHFVLLPDEFLSTNSQLTFINPFTYTFCSILCFLHHSPPHFPLIRCFVLLSEWSQFHAARISIPKLPKHFTPQWQIQANLSVCHWLLLMFHYSFLPSNSRHLKQKNVSSNFPSLSYPVCLLSL